MGVISGIIDGTMKGKMKGETRSLDYSSHAEVVGVSLGRHRGKKGFPWPRRTLWSCCALIRFCVSFLCKLQLGGLPAEPAG